MLREVKRAVKPNYWRAKWFEMNHYNLRIPFTLKKTEIVF